MIGAPLTQELAQSDNLGEGARLIEIAAGEEVLEVGESAGEAAAEIGIRDLDAVMAQLAADGQTCAVVGRAFRVARATESGNLSINSHSSVRYWTPFGGFKKSGLGRELGPDAAEHFTETKNVFYATDAS